MTHPSTPDADSAVRLIRHLIAPDRDAAVLLTAHPGPHWTASLAAAVWGLPLPEAQDRLDRLVHSGVFIAHDDGRHTMPVQVRAALERAGATVLLPGCRRARARVVNYYAEHTIAADLTLDPGRWRWHPPVVEQVRRTAQDRFDSRAQVQMWFHDELANLHAVTALAHRTSHHQQTVLIAEALSAWNELHHPGGTRHIIDLGLASAESMGDSGAQTVMHYAMASWHLHQGNHDKALSLAHYAFALWASEEPRRAHPYHGRGLVHLYLLLGEIYSHDASFLLMAARYADLALGLSERLLHRRDIALARYRHALALSVNDHWSEAAALLRSALPLLLEDGEELWASRVHRQLCEVLLDMGDYKAAREHGLAALAAAPSEEAPLVCGQAHESLAWLAEKQGHLEQAREHFEQARSCYTPMDPARAEQMLATSHECRHPST
ncbi:tetratricopeptide repeat protein [Nocardiopsis synnemataformans]|uniref:tetratricopeptide repeat protein n=1 Tax=Nocardiopsis synnemataformans TaxID=61305 RepID=UPI003EBB705C